MFVLEDSAAMLNRDWRARLRDVIEADGRSHSQIGRDAGLGRTYIHSILKEGKDPGVESLIAVCATLKVSPSYILYGIDVRPEVEELLSLLNENPEKLESLLKLLR